jgi:hypothetical protein
MSIALREREQASMRGLAFLQKPFSAKAIRESIEALFRPIPSLV